VAWLEWATLARPQVRRPVVWKEGVTASTAWCFESAAEGRRGTPEKDPVVSPENRHRRRREEAPMGAERCGCGVRGGVSGASGGSAAVSLRQQWGGRTTRGTPSIWPPRGATVEVNAGRPRLPVAASPTPPLAISGEPDAGSLTGAW
jgi:hypothetical protein